MTTGTGSGGSGSGPGGGGGTGPGRDELADDLDHAELLLRSIQLLSSTALARMDPALKMQLNLGLRTARRAVAAAQTPTGRDHQAAAVAPAIATTGRSGSSPLLARREEGSTPGPAVAVAPAACVSAGGPPAPGAGDTFSLRRPSGPPRFDLGAGPLYDALPGLNASLARRAD